MKIDFEHYKGSQIGDEILNQLDLDRKLSIIKALNPTLGKDGNQFFYIIGNLPEPNCVVGFGDTPYDAMTDFVRCFCSKK